MMTSRPAVLKRLFEASTYPASDNVLTAEICGAMWAAAVALGAAGPVNRSAGATDGEDADDKADKSVSEDC
jgi:hypothetical protein